MSKKIFLCKINSFFIRFCALQRKRTQIILFVFYCVYIWFLIYDYDPWNIFFSHISYIRKLTLVECSLCKTFYIFHHLPKRCSVTIIVSWKNNIAVKSFFWIYNLIINISMCNHSDFPVYSPRDVFTQVFQLIIDVAKSAKFVFLPIHWSTTSYIY